MFYKHEWTNQDMPDEKPATIKKNIQAPTKAQESVGGPRQLNGSQEAPKTTSASISPAKSRPKTD